MDCIFSFFFLQFVFSGLCPDVGAHHQPLSLNLNSSSVNHLANFNGNSGKFAPTKLTPVPVVINEGPTELMIGRSNGGTDRPGRERARGVLVTSERKAKL